MRPARRPAGVVALVIGVAASGAASARAQDMAKAGDLPPAHAAMSGYWQDVTPPEHSFSPTPPDILAKLQPSAAERFKGEQATAAKGDFVPDPGTMCMPSSIPGTGSTGGPAYSFEVLVEPRTVTFLYELSRNSRIAYVGQTQTANFSASWTGHSVAHWEGDTLVVDSLGFNDQNKLKIGANLKTQSSNNLPMSAKMHIVERYRILPDGRLEDQATFDDPGAYTAPFTLVSHYVHGQPFQEYICQENNKEGGIPTASGGRTPNTFAKPSTDRP